MGQWNKKVVVVGLIVMLIVILSIITTLNYFISQKEKIKTNCYSTSDCGCGNEKETNSCFFGNNNYIISSEQCNNFCFGEDKKTEIQCDKNNQCVQVKNK